MEPDSCCWTLDINGMFKHYKIKSLHVYRAWMHLLGFYNLTQPDISNETSPNLLDVWEDPQYTGHNQKAAFLLLLCQLCFLSGRFSVHRGYTKRLGSVGCVWIQSLRHECLQWQIYLGWKTHGLGFSLPIWQDQYSLQLIFGSLRVRNQIALMKMPKSQQLWSMTHQHIAAACLESNCNSRGGAVPCWEVTWASHFMAMRSPPLRSAQKMPRCPNRCSSLLNNILTGSNPISSSLAIPSSPHESTISATIDIQLSNI